MQHKLPMTAPHLPDFVTPPLHEVTLSVQFEVPRGYRQIYANEVWALFRDRYPEVEEHPELPPQFELSGAPSATQIRFELFQGPAGTRHWFISGDGHSVTQFQKDRLTRNWRKVEGQSGQYPRFETIRDEFVSDLRMLDELFRENGWGSVQPNQTEVSYTNHVPVKAEAIGDAAGKVFRHLQFPSGAAEHFNTVYHRPFSDSNWPVGRVTVTSYSGITRDGEPVVVVQLAARGMPLENSIEGARALIDAERLIIAQEFLSIITPEAERAWGRRQ